MRHEEMEKILMDHIDEDIKFKADGVRRTVTLLSTIIFIMVGVVSSSVWLVPFYNTGLRPAWVYCLSKE
jgi:hypothetical protein